MKFSERRKRFQRLLHGDVCVHPASIYDPLSARLVEEVGFELAIFAGSMASLMILGAPDDVLITLTEFATQAYRLCRACTLPILVDADHGYGNALNVRRTVEELEIAGVAALTIEDTELPLAFGKTAKDTLVSVAEGIGKMRAALSARNDPDMAIIGRTSAVSITGVNDAIARANAYADVGVDAIFLAGVETRAQLDVLSAAIRTPLILGYPGAEIQDRAYLASRGVRICLQGHMPIRAAVQALHETYRSLKDGVPPRELEGLAPSDLMSRLTRQKQYADWIKEFMSE
jgi:carboxyvinyl-carboxyphosphonate phosphorylmutase